VNYKIAFEDTPDFKPEDFHFKSCWIGNLIFKNDQIVLEGKEFFASRAILILILPIVIFDLFFLSFRSSVVFLLSLILAIILIAITFFLFFGKRKKKKIAINFKDIESVNLQEYKAGLGKVKWNVINIKMKDREIWIRGRGGFFDTAWKSREVTQKILTDFKRKGLPSKL